MTVVEMHSTKNSGVKCTTMSKYIVVTPAKITKIYFTIKKFKIQIKYSVIILF